MKKLTFLLLFSFNLQAATVLFIGDSHSVGPFGWAMDQHLRDGNHEVATYASCGSILKWWATGQKTPCGYYSRDLKGIKTQLKIAATPILTKLLADVKPDVVVMEFGGNYTAMTNNDAIKKDIRDGIKKIKDAGSACFFITNPDTRKHKEENPRVLKLIKEAVGTDCPVFESVNVTKYPATGGDGVHYWNAQGIPIAKSWAKKAFEAFKVHWK